MNKTLLALAFALLALPAALARGGEPSFVERELAAHAAWEDLEPRLDEQWEALGQAEEEVRVIVEAHGEEPADPAVAEQLARLRQDLVAGRGRIAALFEEYLAAQGETALGLIVRVDYADALGGEEAFRDRVRARLEEVLQLAPGTRFAGRAELRLAGLEEPAAAVARLERLRSFPDAGVRDEALLVLAHHYEGQGRFDEGLALVDELVGQPEAQVAPEELLRLRFSLLVGKGDLEGARALLDKVREAGLEEGLLPELEELLRSREATPAPTDVAPASGEATPAVTPPPSEIPAPSGLPE